MLQSEPRGSRGERMAAEILEQLGYRILERNYHSAFGEIDLIASDETYLCFVEVKARRPGAMVSGAEAVSRSKQRKIISTALAYLQQHEAELQPRFDVMELLMDRAGDLVDYTYLTGAFDSAAYDQNI